MNLTQLRAFYAVAQEGSFTKAADFLCVSQPVMTAHVSALEDMYGVLLFHRHGRSITLTEAGEGLLVIARDIFIAEEKAEEYLHSYKELEAGTLRISVGNPYSLAPILAEFHKTYPKVKTQVLPGNHEDVRELLMAEHADIAVQSEPEPSKQTSTLPIGQHQLVAFASKDNPYMKGKTSVTMAELCDMPLVLRKKGSFTRQFFDEACTECCANAEPSVIATNRESVFELVANGVGVGVVFSGEIPQDPRIVSLPIDGQTKKVTDYLMYLNRKSEMRIIKAFIKIAEKFALPQS